LMDIFSSALSPLKPFAEVVRDFFFSILQLD
jgi:hypothetical protein